MRHQQIAILILILLVGTACTGGEETPTPALIIPPTETPLPAASTGAESDPRGNVAATALPEKLPSLIPEIPEMPEVPDLPGVPEVPEVPEIPATPGG